MPKLVIGDVIAGDEAAAFFRRDENGAYILNLTLSRGKEGPQGRTGIGTR